MSAWEGSKFQEETEDRQKQKAAGKTSRTREQRYHGGMRDLLWIVVGCVLAFCMAYGMAAMFGANL